MIAFDFIIQKEEVEDLISAIDVNNPNYAAAIEDLTQIYCDCFISISSYILLFTEEVIRKCFDTSMRTVDSNGKEVTCDFINLMCGVNGRDVSSADGQCECLLEAITV